MILAINTSTPQFSVALLKEDGTVLAEYLTSEGKGHFGSLMPAFHFLLSTSKSDVHSIKSIAIATGPGSFTGLRVGLSVAKGLCHALAIPIIGVSSLEAMASQILYSDLPVISILDSRKGEVFAARFVRSNKHELIRNSEDICLKIEEFSSLLREPSLFIGNDFTGQGSLVEKILGPRACIAPAHYWNLKASAVGFLGLKRLHARNFDDPQALEPVYSRPPDIQPNPFPQLSDPVRQRSGLRHSC